MAYDRAFNTPLIIFTAFSGEMKRFPKLNWIRRPASDFGFASSDSIMYVYANAKSNIIKCRNEIAYYNQSTKDWITFAIAGFKIIYYGNGVYMGISKDVVYTSADGKVWRFNGVLPNLVNSVICGASNGVRGAISAWYVGNPMYIKEDVLTYGNWTLAGTWWHDRICSFENMTFHRGMFVGIADDTIEGSEAGGIQISADGKNWIRTIQHPIEHPDYDYNYFSGIRSIGEKLFLKASHDKAGTYNHLYQICIMNDGASSYRVIFETTEIIELDAIQFVEKLGRYLWFDNNVIHSSVDGYSWESVPQTGFSGGKYTAMYVPGDGFYVGVKDSYVYYAAYP